MEGQIACEQWPKGLCRRHERCKFYHAPLDIPLLRPGQCSFLRNGAKRCENNAAFVEADRALCFDHTEAGLTEQHNTSGRTRSYIPQRATKRVSGKGRMVDPFQVRHRVENSADASSTTVADKFTNEKLPLIVDVGCAQGRFILHLAKAYGDAGLAYNYVGYELRGLLVEAANDVVKRSELEGKVAFMQGEAKSMIHTTLGPLLRSESAPVAEVAPNSDESPSTTTAAPTTGAFIEWLTIQFPDPWTKAKHHKRRLVDAQFVQDCARLMSDPRSKVYICSDRYDLACFMYDSFASSALWRVVPELAEVGITPTATTAVEAAERLTHPSALPDSRAVGNTAEASATGTEAPGSADTGASASAGPSSSIGAADGELDPESEEAWCREVYRAKDADDTRAWLSRRPFPVGTERDSVAERQNRPVHRAVFQRTLQV